jgi:hypothetical protein
MCVCVCLCEDLFSVLVAPLQLVLGASMRKYGKLCAMWGWVGEGGGVG